MRERRREEGRGRLNDSISALNEKKAEVRVQYKSVNGDIYPSGDLKR